MAKKASTAGYRLHKASGQAIVKLKGRTYYLGRYGSPESKEKYHRLVAESMVSNTFGMKDRQVSVAEAINSYLEHAERYYNGGSEYKGVYDACEPLARLFASLPIRDFGIPQFKVIRQHWIKRGCSRRYVNKQMKRLLRVAKWWVAEQIADPMLHHSLKCVDNLKQGRCDVPEADPITPVSDADVESAIKFMPKVVADMVRLQRLVGCRPGELVQIKPAMVDASGDVWTITIVDHKNAWRGKDRVIAVGPKAQAILKPYLDRGLSEYCFSPKEAMQQRDEARHQQESQAEKGFRVLHHRHLRQRYTLRMQSGED